MSADAWELSKENVMPLKRGRSAKGLSEAILKIESTSGNKSIAIDLEAQKLRLFEDALSKSKNDDEIIELYMRYVPGLDLLL
jgi:hypothetical protein